MLTPIFKIKSFFLRRTRRVKNLLFWLKIIWNDENFDYSHILIILRKKVELTRRTMERSKFHAHSTNKLRKIAVVETLIGRILDDDYCGHELDEHTQKWGKLQFLERNKEEGLSGLRREKVLTRKDADRESREIRTIFDKMERLRERDLDLVFKILRRNIQSWWD